MKQLLTLFGALLVMCTANAQLLTLTSKDSLNGKPVKEFYTTAWVKLMGFYDAQGISNVSSMNLPSIPTDGRPADPQFHMDLHQTRLIFASRFQTESLGEIYSYIETDFFGDGAGKLRMRHAYVEFKNVLIGQTWSSFTDGGAWPNIADFDGPPSGAWVRNAQIGYKFDMGKKSHARLSLETPMQDYSRYLPYDTNVTQANQKLPDLVGHINKDYNNGHIRLSGVLRGMDYKGINGEQKYAPAGGANISGHQKVFKEDKITYQVIAGSGINRYMVSFGGGGWDGRPDPATNELKPVFGYGGYVAYQLFWNKKNIALKKNIFSTTALIGYTNLEDPVNTTSNNPLIEGVYTSANLYWNIVEPLNVAIEGIYGNRTDEDGRTGDNFRLQFVMEYAF